MSSDTLHAVPRRPWLSFFGTLACFSVLGPPLGALVVIVLKHVIPSFVELPYFMLPWVGVDNPVSLLLLLTVIFISYFAGGVQAFVCGLAIGAYGLVKGRPPLWFAMLAPIVLFGICYFFFWSELPETRNTMLVVHLVPALLCWLLTRNFWFAKI